MGRISKGMVKKKIKDLEAHLGLSLKLSDSGEVDGESYYRLNVVSDDNEYDVLSEYEKSVGDRSFSKREIYAFLCGSLATVDWMENKEKYLKEAIELKMTQGASIELKSSKVMPRKFHFIKNPDK